MAMDAFFVLSRQSRLMFESGMEGGNCVELI